jgi:hypothetical protein
LSFRKEINKIQSILITSNPINSSSSNTNLTLNANQEIFPTPDNALLPPNSSKQSETLALQPPPIETQIIPKVTSEANNSSEYIAFRVELKANKIEMKTFENTTSEKTKSNNSSNSNNSMTSNIYQQQLESCIMFNLTFPTIAYYQGKLTYFK